MRNEVNLRNSNVLTKEYTTHELANVRLDIRIKRERFAIRQRWTPSCLANSHYLYTAQEL
jgi:hypothetical protein